MYDVPKSPKDTQVERLKALIDEGADVYAARVDMATILLAIGAAFHGGELAQAALAGSEDKSLVMITALLQAGADVNSRRFFQGGCAAPDHGFTALLWASYQGSKNAVKLLLAQPGIKLEETNDDGDTALVAAAELGHAEIVEMLLKAGANVRFTNIGGETAITRAQ